MNKALFLDRDGVINIDKDYICSINDFEFVDGIFEITLKFQNAGYVIIVITNQSGIARGYYTEKDFEALNKWMVNEFEKKGVTIAMTYYCPYHPTAGIGEYLKESGDRKPDAGMIFKAQKDFNLDLSESVLIGDRKSDIEAGRRAGVGKLVYLSDTDDIMEDGVVVVKSLYGLSLN